MDTSFPSEPFDPPPFAGSYLRTLGRMQQQQALWPEQATERARTLLQDRFTPAREPTEAAFAHGALGLLAGHTNYFEGFAVLMPVQQGTAVAVRETDADVSRLTFEGSQEQWTFDRSDTSGSNTEQPVWVCLVEELVRRLGTRKRQVEVAVVATVQPGCIDAYLAALGVATVRALQAYYALPDGTEQLLRRVRAIIAACIDWPFSLAYLLGAAAGLPGAFLLVDTATLEHVPLDVPSREALGWGMVDVGFVQTYHSARQRQRENQAAAALAALRQRGFEHLTSFRELEHRDLQRALDVLPRSLRPIVRHLVSENRRVQKLVAAVRRRDWQLFGALLLMSHASLRNDWDRLPAEVDFVVEQAEAMTLEGLYGACVTGRSGCVLIAGQPFQVLPGMDRIKAAFAERFDREPEILLL